MAEPTPTPSPGPAVAFAEWLPALGGSRLLRVHGEAPTPEPPTLVLTLAGVEHRIEPRSQSRFTRPDEWRASYLIPAEHAHAGSTVPALEWPDGTRLNLPEPPSQPRAEVIEPSVLTSLRARRAGAPPTPTGLATPPLTAQPPTPEASLTATESPARPGRAAPPSAAELLAPPALAAPPSAAVPPAPAADPPALSARSADVLVPPFSAAPPTPPAWTDLPVAFSRSVFEPEALWTAKRAELERELGRAAHAITRARAGERESRDAMIAALAEVRADLRAARAARQADVGVIAILTAELEAERIAHAVARQTAAALRTALAEARAATAHAAQPPHDPQPADATRGPRRPQSRNRRRATTRFSPRQRLKRRPGRRR